MQNQTPDGKQGCPIKEQAWNFHSTEVETIHQRSEMGFKRRDGANTFPCLLQCPKLAVLAHLFTSSSTGCLTSECRNTTFWPFSSRTQLSVFHAAPLLIYLIPVSSPSPRESMRCGISAVFDSQSRWLACLKKWYSEYCIRNSWKGGFQRDGEY